MPNQRLKNHYRQKAKVFFHLMHNGQRSFDECLRRTRHRYPSSAAGEEFAKIARGVWERENQFICNDDQQRAAAKVAAQTLADDAVRHPVHRTEIVQPTRSETPQKRFPFSTKPY